MLRLVHDTPEDSDSIPFPIHRVAPRGRLVGLRDGEEALRALERAQAQLDEIRELNDFAFYQNDEGPRAA